MYKIYIANLPAKIKSHQLNRLFSQFTKRFKIERSRSRGKNALYHAVLELLDEDVFSLLIKNPPKLDGVQLNLTKFVPKEERAGEDEVIMNRKVYVGDIPEQLDEETIRFIISGHGEVEQIYLRTDVNGSILYAFVTFLNAKDSSKLLTEGKIEYGDFIMSVKEYRAKTIESTSLGVQDQKNDNRRCSIIHPPKVQELPRKRQRYQSDILNQNSSKTQRKRFSSFQPQLLFGCKDGKWSNKVIRELEHENDNIRLNKE